MKEVGFVGSLSDTDGRHSLEKNKGKRLAGDEIFCSLTTMLVDAAEIGGRYLAGDSWLSLSMMRSVLGW